MKRYNVKWLEHLEEAVPEEGFGNRLSMYLIALEAWRRGISVDFFTIDNPENKLLIRYALRLGEKEHRFVSSRGDKLTEKAFEICDNKDLTKQYLKRAGIKVPKGKRFPDATKNNQEIIDYAVSLDFPVVLKPVSENAGRGVFSNIQTKEEFINTLNYLCDTLNYTDIIVEESIPGTEYRVLTVGDKILAAVNRLPANIVGDGENTIEALIKEKNALKKDNPSLSKKIIQMDKEVMGSIEKLGYTVESIPNNGEQIFLRTKSNISSGGDPIDVTDKLTEEHRSIVTKSIQAIPGLACSGMDLIINPHDHSATVIEVNTKPMLGLHVFPMKGTARDVVKEIVDYYFPETMNRKKTNLYFDFERVVSPLDNLSTKRIELVPPPTLEEVHAKLFILTGEGFNGRLRNHIRLTALKNGLHGHVKKMDNHTMELLFGSERKIDLNQFISECEESYGEEINIQEITEETWDKSILIGFKIIQKTRKELKDERRELKDIIKKMSSDNNDLEKKNKMVEKDKRELKQKLKKVKRENKDLNKNLNQMKNNYDQIKRQLETLNAENKILNNELKSMKNSRSWRITKPLRRVNSALKKEE